MHAETIASAEREVSRYQKNGPGPKSWAALVASLARPELLPTPESLPVGSSENPSIYSTNLQDAATIALILSSDNWPAAKAWLATTVPDL